LPLSDSSLFAPGYHAGIIRTLLYSLINTTPAYNSTVGQITSAITDTLNKLSGDPQLKYPLTNVNGSALANVGYTGERFKPTKI
jgi:hypothetical protein